MRRKLHSLVSTLLNRVPTSSGVGEGDLGWRVVVGMGLGVREREPGSCYAILNQQSLV